MHIYDILILSFTPSWSICSSVSPSLNFSKTPTLASAVMITLMWSTPSPSSDMAMGWDPPGLDKMSRNLKDHVIIFTYIVFRVWCTVSAKATPWCRHREGPQMEECHLWSRGSRDKNHREIRLELTEASFQAGLGRVSNFSKIKKNFVMI